MFTPGTLVDYNMDFFNAPMELHAKPYKMRHLTKFIFEVVSCKAEKAIVRVLSHGAFSLSHTDPKNGRIENPMRYKKDALKDVEYKFDVAALREYKPEPENKIGYEIAKKCGRIVLDTEYTTDGIVIRKTTDLFGIGPIAEHLTDSTDTKSPVSILQMPENSANIVRNAIGADEEKIALSAVYTAKTEPIKLISDTGDAFFIDRKQLRKWKLSITKTAGFDIAVDKGGFRCVNLYDKADTWFGGVLPMHMDAIRKMFPYLIE